MCRLPIPVVRQILGILAAALLVWLPPGPVCGDDAPTGPSAAASSSRPAGGQTKLNFVSKEWGDVLRQVARDTNSELVMPEVPPGKFSRVDFGKHNREDAVRILNRDLQKTGFRLIAENDELHVISIKRQRPEYEQKTVPQYWHAANSPGSRPGPPQAAPQNSAHSIQRVGYEEAPAAAQPAAESPVRPAAPPPAARATTLTIQPRNRPALDIAKQIHSGFGKRSRLEKLGPNQLPAFVVDHFDPAALQAGRPLFVVEIDSGRNELLVTADGSVQQGLRQLINRIDVNPIGNQRIPAIVAEDPKTVATGRQLQQPLSLIAQLRQQPPVEEVVPRPPVAPLGRGQNSQPPAAEERPQREVQQFGQTQELPELIGRLQGDVTIQALDELDLLIIEGNERDIDSVQRVINEIERLAAGSLPEIHLLRLEHVDSQSLSALLNDVYARMAELRTNQAQRSQASVRVIPVVMPNAILVLAPTNAMQTILELADELDQPVDPSHEIRVFRLKHAVANSVVERLQTFYGDTPVGLATRLKAAADIRTNSVIVQANPRDLTGIAEFIKGMDVAQAESVAQMRVIPLRSAAADELAIFLNSAVQSALGTAPGAVAPGQATGIGIGGAPGANPNQEARAIVLEFLTEEGQQLIRSGLLHDVRFNADPRTNNLLVTAPEESMPLILELVKILDRPSEAQAEIKVFPLTQADATSAVTLLDGLFNPGQAQQLGAAGRQQQALGIEIAGAEGTSSNLVPLRFYADARTNSVVAIGGPGAMRMVQAILLRLDSSTAQNRKFNVIKLRNSPAADVAASINEFLASQRELATIDPERISTSQLLEQEIIVTAEPISNQLIISATPAYYQIIEELARKLDAEPPQVVIQAMIVEVELDNTDEFGVELGFQDPVLFNRSTLDAIQTITQTISQPGQPQITNTQIVSQQGQPGFNFNNQPLGNNIAPASNPSKVGTQGLTNFAVGRVNNELGYGGLVLSASSESVSVLIRALAARRTLRVLSRPQVTVLDNQEAQVQVGQVVPVVDGLTITAQGIVNPTIIRDPAGIILTVRPRISPEGQIVMLVTAEKSVYGGASVPIGSDGVGGVITSPIKDITTAYATLKVPDGQTTILGGMITKSDQNVERKIPWLGDLPLIGNIFRYDLHEFRRTELLIFLTPRIVHCPADMETIKQVEAGRLHYFQDDVESLHGPLFGVPAEMTMPLEQWPPVQILQPMDGHPSQYFAPGHPQPTPTLPPPQQQPRPELPRAPPANDPRSRPELIPVPPEPTTQREGTGVEQAAAIRPKTVLFKLDEPFHE